MTVKAVRIGLLVPVCRFVNYLWVRFHSQKLIYFPFFDFIAGTYLLLLFFFSENDIVVILVYVYPSISSWHLTPFIIVVSDGHGAVRQWADELTPKMGRRNADRVPQSYTDISQVIEIMLLLTKIIFINKIINKLIK